MIIICLIFFIIFRSDYLQLLYLGAQINIDLFSRRKSHIIAFAVLHLDSAYLCVDRAVPCSQKYKLVLYIQGFLLVYIPIPDIGIDHKAYR